MTTTTTASARRIELLKQLNKAIEDHNRAYESGNSRMLAFWEIRIRRISDQLDKA